jgi:hypothetical protein
MCDSKVPAFLEAAAKSGGRCKRIVFHLLPRQSDTPIVLPEPTSAVPKQTKVKPVNRRGSDASSYSGSGYTTERTGNDVSALNSARMQSGLGSARSSAMPHSATSSAQASRRPSMEPNSARGILSPLHAVAALERSSSMADSTADIDNGLSSARSGMGSAVYFYFKNYI